MALKRIITFLVLASSAWATVWTPADGNLPTIQNIINNTTPPILASGDRIVIPDSSGEATGMWEWNGTLRINKGFNIELYGADGTIAHRPTIHGNTVGTGGMVWYTCGNPTPRKTGLIYNIDFYSKDDQLRVDGVSTYTVSGTTVTGGMRVGYCAFRNPYYDGAGKTMTGCSAAANSTALTCTGGTFAAGDAGRVVYIPGDNSKLEIQTRITQFVDSTHVNLKMRTKAAFSGQTLQLTGTTPNSGGDWLKWSGWVFGVIDHCELDWNLLRPLTVRADGAHSSSPIGWAFPSSVNGNGDYGDYASAYLPPNKQDIAGNIDGLYFEDNIFHFGTAAIIDCGSNSGTTQGGGIFIFRHNTTWGSLATHGVRESGTQRFSAVLLEYTKNHHLRSVPTLGPSPAPVQPTDSWEQRDDITPIEQRDGENVSVDNYMTMQAGARSNSTGMNSWGGLSGGTDSCGAFSVYNYDDFYWGPDGLNPLDKNQRGPFDFKGFHHDVFATYEPPVRGPGLDIITGFTSSGQNSTDTVVHGKDSDTRFGDVYATVSIPAGNYTSYQLNGKAIINGATGATVTGTNLCGASPCSASNPIPANYFKGFVLRNPTVRRGRPNSEAFVAWKVITASTAGSGAGNINFTFRGTNPCGSDITLNTSGNFYEIRKVGEYFGVVGRGPMNPGFVPGFRPPRLANDNAEGQNPYWTSDTVGGSYNWGTRKRVGTGPGGYSDWSQSTNEINYFTAGDPFQVLYIDRGYQQALGNATSIRSLQFHPGLTFADLTADEKLFKPLFDKGYKWDDTALAGTNGPDTIAGTSDDVRPETRVGADWGKTFVDPATGQTLCSTIGPQSPPLPRAAATPNTITPEFSSFYRPGAPGFTYPHPLVATPASANTAPTITSPNSTTFTASVAADCSSTPTVNCFTVRTTGNPAPTFTPAPTPKPAFLTATDNGDGTLTMSGNPPASPTSYAFKITAHNSEGNATQDPFTLNVINPTQVSLTKPANNTNFSPAPATIDMAASVSGTPGTVDFKSNGTTINSDTTAPYELNGTSFIAGTYDLTACVGTTCSDTVTVTVTAANPTPTPAEIQVLP